jgi:hypothetical protein
MRESFVSLTQTMSTQLTRSTYVISLLYVHVLLCLLHARRISMHFVKYSTYLRFPSFARSAPSGGSAQTDAVIANFFSR